jgi:molybdopterin-guanine dinucleotide biosynthesis protein A
VGLLAVAIVGLASLAYADPRHVRILWDVRNERTCARVDLVTAPFDLPEAWPCDKDSARTLPACTGHWCLVPEGLVQPGDYVTVYAHNYNAVSYKPLAPLVTTLAPEEPVAITLLAALLQAAGIKTFAAVDTPYVADRLAASTCSTRPIDPNACLAEIGKAAAAVEGAIAVWETSLRDDAADVAEKRPLIPRNLTDTSKPGYPDFGIQDLDDLACRFSVLSERSPLGGASKNSTGWIQDVGAALGRVTALIRAFDGGYDPGRVTEGHLAQRNAYQRAVDGWIEYLVGNQTGVRSQLAAGVAQLAEDLAAIRSYRNALNAANARRYAVEIPRQGPVKRLTTLVFALPLRFVGDPENAPAETTKTYTLEVAANRPPVIASAGVIVLPLGTFGFKKLAIEQVPGDTPGTVKRVFATPDTDEFREVTALIATNFRLSGNPSVPYAVVGTTADKKIFESLVVGGSWFVPRWRSLLTVGLLMAKGSTDDEIQPIIDQYGGVPPDALNPALVSVPEKWRATLVIGWTFTPF